VGAVLLSILGDRFGRKSTIVVGCLVLAVFQPSDDVRDRI